MADDIWTASPSCIRGNDTKPSHRHGHLLSSESSWEAGFALPPLTWPRRQTASRRIPFLMLGGPKGASHSAKASPLSEPANLK